MTMHCFRCNIDKPASEFSRGRKSWCDVCKAAYDAAYQRKIHQVYYDTDALADLPALDEEVEWKHTDPTGREVNLTGKMVGHSDGRPVVQVAGCHFKLKKVQGEGWST
jgi:hypothetical protein